LVEVWRTDRLAVAPGAFLATTSVIDHEGRVIVGGYARVGIGGPLEIVVARFGENGQVDWEYRTGEESPDGVDALAVDAEGNVYVAARLSSLEPRPVALIKLEADGSEGWRHVETDAAAMGGVTGCAVAVDAPGNAFFLFARQPGAGWPEPGEYAVAKFRPDGTRLWKCVMPPLAYGFPLGGIWRCLTVAPYGSARWHSWGRFQGGLLPARDAEGYWLLAGLGPVGYSTELVVQRFDGRGVRSPVGETSGYLYDLSGDRPTSALLAAPDGTLRLVVNLRPQYWSPPTGLAVVALAVEGVADGPGIAELPKSATWDGSNAVTITVTPADSGQARIQWFWEGDPLSGATNEVLTVRAADLPKQRGYYHAELSDERGAVVTPLAELRFGRVLLEALTANFNGDHWLEVTADLTARFRLETSSDLRHWLALDDRVRQAGTHGPVAGPGQEPAFYRAVVVP
jgi:hypothetical protein